MSRLSWSALTPTCLLLLACKSPLGLEAEPPAPQSAPTVVAPALQVVPPGSEARASPHIGAHENGAPDPHLPVVGDPLGLLSRPAPASAPAPPALAAKTSGFDPGALMRSAQDVPETKVELERDPRAVARAAAALQESSAPRPTSALPRNVAAQPVEEKSAAEVFGSIRRGAARPHVLFLYAAYCPGCRKVMPSFLPLVHYYKPRGVQFTAASVDRDRLRYEDYAPVLGGVLPPVLIRSEGSTASEMRRAGLTVAGDSFSIPLVALFDKTRRLVMQGGGATMARLPQALDGLL